MPKPIIVALAVALALLPVAAVAQAACFHNGQAVPDGTRMGDLRCQNGIWVVVP